MIFPSELSLPGAWFSLGVFMACISCVILTPKIPIFPRKRLFTSLLSKFNGDPNPKRTPMEVELVTFDEALIQPEAPKVDPEPYFYWITADMAKAPVISLILLFITGCLNWDTFSAGIAGDEQIRPYGVIILFMTLSYVCVSLDITGLFEYIAKVLIRKSAGDGHALWIFFAIFASVLTLFTSNDIVILTLTPICCYLAANAENLDLIPFVVSQFFLANVWSVAFQIGNPTNMIVAEAYKMNFLSYLLMMGLPAIAAGLINFGLLYYMFFDRIPRFIVTSQASLGTIPKIPNQRESTIKAIGLLLTLVLLAASSLIPLSNGKTIPSYLICLAAGALFFLYDIIMDTSSIQDRWWDMSISALFQDKRTMMVILRMPWGVIPFVFGMFVMVELLNSYGFVTLIASALTDIINSVAGTPTDGVSFTGILTACFVMSILSTLSCNILNNQPMTILFTKILLSSAYVQDATLQKASSLSLVLGSNLGANVTLIGALAGVMWIKILQDNGITHQQMNYWKFLKYGMIVTPLALAGATLIIAIEMQIISP